MLDGVLFFPDGSDAFVVVFACYSVLHVRLESNGLGSPVSMPFLILPCSVCIFADFLSL